MDKCPWNITWIIKKAVYAKGTIKNIGKERYYTRTYLCTNKSKLSVTQHKFQIRIEPTRQQNRSKKYEDFNGNEFNWLWTLRIIWIGEWNCLATEMQCFSIIKGKRWFIWIQKRINLKSKKNAWNIDGRSNESSLTKLTKATDKF